MQTKSWEQHRERGQFFIQRQCPLFLEGYYRRITSQQMPPHEFEDNIRHILRTLETAQKFKETYELAQKLIIALKKEPANIGYGKEWLELNLFYYKFTNARYKAIFQYNIANIYNTLNELEDSIEWVERAIQTSTQNNFWDILCQSIILKASIYFSQNALDTVEKILLEHQELLQSSYSDPIQYTLLVASLQRRKGNVSKALEEIQTLIGKLKAQEQPIGPELIYRHALLEWTVGNYDQALAEYKSLERRKEQLLPTVYAGLICDIGLVYWCKGELNISKDYFLRSLEIAERYGNFTEIAATGNLGINYLAQGKIQKALFYFNLQLQKAQKAKAFLEINRATSNSGRAYFHLGNYEKALALLDEALRHYESNILNEGIIDILLYKARCFIAVGNYAQARELINIAVNWVEQNDHLGAKIVIYRLKAEYIQDKKEAKQYVYCALELSKGKRRLDEAACLLALSFLEEREDYFKQGQEILYAIGAEQWLENCNDLASLRILSML